MVQGIDQVTRERPWGRLLISNSPDSVQLQIPTLIPEIPRLNV